MPIRFEQTGRLARITLARPPLNILDVEHLQKLAGCIDELGTDAAILIIDAGDARVFSAGNDIKDHTPKRAPEMLRAFHEVVTGLLSIDAITIADVRGDALGAGCELVCACDLAFAAEGAKFGFPEIDVGCFPPVAAVLLPARVGWTRAVQMITTGRRIDAATAASIGLITDVGPAEPVIEELLAKSPAVLRLAKKAMRVGHLESAERVYIDELLKLGDCEEGVRAFLEKRPPRWEA